MSKYIEELMSPQLMFAMYGFIAFVVALYLLSVVYVFIDAKRRGVQAFWAWGLLALVPFVGLMAYIVMRPASYVADREEQELDMAPAPTAAPPSRRTSSSARCATRRSATSAPRASARWRRTGRSAPSAELTSNRRELPRAPHGADEPRRNAPVTLWMAGAFLFRASWRSSGLEAQLRGQTGTLEKLQR